MPSNDDLFRSRGLPRLIARRAVLGTMVAGAAAGTIALTRSPGGFAAGGRRLRIATFGGDFGQQFQDHIYPAFTRATGIAVTPVSRPGGVQFLLQLEAANRAGSTPVDLCCVAESEMLRGRMRGIWRTLAPEKLPNLARVSPADLRPGPYGQDGIPAMAWFMTLVANPHEVRPLPDSWQAMWHSAPATWGIQSGSSSPLFEIAATLRFGSVEVLNTRPGIDAVVAEMAKLRRNVKLWWSDEGTMQTAIQNDEVAGGTFLHDTTQALAAQGTPIRSIFPREGAVRGLNMWCQPSASRRTAEADAFLDFACSPKAQVLIARHVRSAPVLPAAALDLTPEEFAAVSTSGPSIPNAVSARVSNSSYLEERFTRMVMA